MKEISRVALNITPSVTLEVDSLAKQMKADGLDVIGFGAGEPDFQTYDNIKEAGIEAIKEGHTKYTPAAGLPAVRQAVARRLLVDTGVDYKPEEIVVTSGAKHAIFAAVMCLMNPGDEAIVPAPYWVTYTEIVQMAGGIPVIVTADEESEFKITAQQLEAAITPKTKLLILNNPSNPTGALYTKGELAEIIDVCLKHDLYIISDEVYYRLVYDGLEFVSVASFGEDVRERTITINGVSKSYAMTGWRIGYSASSSKIAKIISNYLGHSTSGPSTISQYAAIEALDGDQTAIDNVQKVFEDRRNYIIDEVNSISGISCIKPQGAFYVMINLKDLIGRQLGGRVIKDANDFAIALLENAHVALVPCVGFGAPNYVRMTYAASIEDIKEGLRRIKNFLED